MRLRMRLLIAVVVIAIATIATVAARASITLTNAETHTANGSTVETDAFAAASEVHIYRAPKTVVLVYTTGTTAANGEVVMGSRSKPYTLTITPWNTGAWSDSLATSGTLTAPQLTSLQTQLNGICDSAENLVIALGKFSGSKNAC
jgi:hypothetical protein